MTLNIGDVVRLKSGGPLMTVVGESTYGDVNCQWFTKDQEPKSNSFPEEAIEIEEK